MDFAAWLAFVPATFLISITPGPNMLLMLALGLHLPWTRIWPAMLGAITVVLAMLVASSLGVAVLLIKAPMLFLGLKIAGAAYLSWLGLQLIFQKAETVKSVETEEAEQEQKIKTVESGKTPRELFWRAVAVASSNPKAIVFAAAYFPQFIKPDRSVWAQLAVLLPTFVVIEVACYLLYAKSGKQMADWFAKPGVLQNFNRVIGLVFIGFGLAIALT